MRVYRPNSIFTLIMIAMITVILPLLVAIVTAVLKIERIARESHESVMNAELATQASQTLVEKVTAMERSAKQFLVLDDPELLKVYKDGRGEFLKAIDMMKWVKIVDEEQINALAEAERNLSTRLERGPRGVEPGPEVDAAFSELARGARNLVSESSRRIWQRTTALPEAAARLNRALLWLSAIALIATLGLGALFVVIINRPLQQIDLAIRRLGSGKFDVPIRIDAGPRDLGELGQRLEWLRARLVELESQKLDFLRHISHELKTPLTAIREGVDLLGDRRAQSSAAERDEIARIVRDNSLRLQTLIENLLQVSAARSTIIGGVRQPVSLHRVVRKVVTDHKLAISSKALEVELDTTRVRLSADPEQLRIVVDNLISNAVKFSPTGGRIEVRLRTTDEAATLDVRDEGPGISDFDRGRVFEPFFQGEAVAMGPLKGTGLGLAIASDYVKAHDGIIEVVDAVRGAHLRVSLPLQPMARC